jgi:NTP pyrophosphatase (non-canonical NTP hydrolase)
LNVTLIIMRGFTMIPKAKHAGPIDPTQAISKEESQAQQAHAALQHELAVIFNALAPTLQVSFRQLDSLVTAWNTAQGFWECDNFGEKIALCHSELSEALEAHRKGLASDHLPGFSGVEEELADTLLRIFDLAGKFQLRLGEAVIEKLLFNLQRPYKHGKAY